MPSLLWIRVMLSPLSIILPNFFSVCLFMWHSLASSRTRFMYSSNPTICPSILVFTFSYNQTTTLVLFWRYLKMYWFWRKLQKKVILLPENEVDRLHHHLLNFLTATVGHFALVIKTYSVKKNNYWWCKRFVVKAETHQIWTFSKNSILTSFHTISSQQKSQFRHWKKSITARI